LARALWGSTAEEIIAEAPCPVLTIRPPQRDFVEHRGHDTEINLNRILLATNFRPSSLAATNLARELATGTKAELHAIYVIGDYFEQISVMFPEGARAARPRKSRAGSVPGRPQTSGSDEALRVSSAARSHCGNESDLRPQSAEGRRHERRHLSYLDDK